MVYKITRRRRRNTKKRSKKRLRGGSIPEKCIFIKFIRKDGLGNRLFIYSVARVISKDTGHSICMIVEPENSNPHSKTNYNNLYSNVQFVKEDDVKTRLDKAFELYREIVFGDLSKDEYMVDRNRDFLLQSSCQNYPFVKEVLPDIRKMLIDNEFHKDAYKDLKTKINSKYSAFMHVRRGDYVSLGWALPAEYYCNGLKELEKNSEIKNIYVVSDDLAWCKEQKEKWGSCAPNKVIEILEGLNELQTFYAMMLCEAGAVISNSTFSAWGAMLGADKNTKSTNVYSKTWITGYPGEQPLNPLRLRNEWIGIENTVQKGGKFIYNHKFSFISLIPGQTLSFVSYGDDKFKDAKERIKNQANAMGCFDGQIQIYGPEDLSDDFKAKVGDVLKEPRGGGFWTWKSFIISDMLSKLNDNDILLYADSGCSLQPVGIPKLKDYINMISPESGKSVLCMRLLDGSTYGDNGFLQKKWTTNAVFDYFNIPVESEIGNLNQILGTCCIFRKSPESVAVVKKWLDIAITNPILFTDKFNKESKTKNPAFKDNRHDQSIFTMIVQTEPYKNTCLIIDEEIEVNHGTPKTESIKASSPVIASRLKT